MINGVKKSKIYCVIQETDVSLFQERQFHSC